MCALTRTYIACTSTYYVDVTELPPSRPGTQPLVMLLSGFFWRSNRNHYLLVLVMRALATSISMYVRTCRNSINKCTTMIPTALRWRFCTANIVCFGTKYDANLELKSCQVLFINLFMHQDPKNIWRVPFKIHFFFRTSRSSRSASIRVHV